MKGINSMKQIKQEECLDIFTSGIDYIARIHEQKKVLCNYLKEWRQRDYGWSNPLFTPQYQRACLNGVEFVPDYSCDLYIFMIIFYEIITNRGVPVNFRRNGRWKFGFINSTPNFDTSIRNSIMILFEWCTKIRVDNRPYNAIELKQTEYYNILQNKLKEHKEYERKNTFEKREANLFKECSWKDIFL